MDKSQIIWTTVGGLIIAVVSISGTHFFSLIRSRMDSKRKPKERAWVDIEKALNEYRDWHLEMMVMFRMPRGSASYSALLSDKRSTEWIERFKENEAFLPGVKSASRVLHNRQEHLNSRIQRYGEFPKYNRDDRDDIRMFIAKESSMYVTDLERALKNQDELLKQLKAYTRYLCHKGVSGEVKPTGSYRHEEGLHMSPKGVVFVGHYDKWDEPSRADLVFRYLWVGLLIPIAMTLGKYLLNNH